MEKTVVSRAPLGKVTVRQDLQPDDLALHVDLAGLVYPANKNTPVPIIMVGLPPERVDEFFGKFFKPGTPRKTIRKKNGNREYVRIGRSLDLYKICRALDGHTQVHQRAVQAIKQKLEKIYGKERLLTALQEAAAKEAAERVGME